MGWGYVGQLIIGLSSAQREREREVWMFMCDMLSGVFSLTNRSIDRTFLSFLTLFFFFLFSFLFLRGTTCCFLFFSLTFILQIPSPLIIHFSIFTPTNFFFFFFHVSKSQLYVAIINTYMRFSLFKLFVECKSFLLIYTRSNIVTIFKLFLLSFPRYYLGCSNMISLPKIS